MTVLEFIQAIPEPVLYRCRFNVDGVEFNADTAGSVQDMFDKLESGELPGNSIVEEIPAFVGDSTSPGVINFELRCK